MILGKKYSKVDWAQFLVDYNPDHTTSGEVIALHWPQLEFYKALHLLLATIGFDLTKMKNDDDPDHYMAFLCYCSWVGHGVHLLTELENTEKVKELDYLLTAYNDAVHNAHANILLARDLCRAFDVFIVEIQYYLEETCRNSENYSGDTEACFTFLMKQGRDFNDACLEVLRKAKPSLEADFLEEAEEEEEEDGKEEE